MVLSDRIDLALQATFTEMFKSGFNPEKVVMIADVDDRDVLISIITPNQVPSTLCDFEFDDLNVRLFSGSPVLGDPETTPELYTSYLNFWYGNNAYCEVLVPTPSQLMWYKLYGMIGVEFSQSNMDSVLELFIQIANHSISESWEHINECVDSVGELAESLLYVVQQSGNEYAINKWIQLIRECDHIRVGDRAYLEDVVSGSWLHERIARVKAVSNDDIDHNQWLYEFESDDLSREVTSSVFEK